MAEQTAVEWLELVYHSQQGYISKKDIKQAKVMEKEQTINFAYSFYDKCFAKNGIIQKTAGEYYNETYS